MNLQKKLDPVVYGRKIDTKRLDIDDEAGRSDLFELARNVIITTGKSDKFLAIVFNRKEIIHTFKTLYDFSAFLFKEVEEGRRRRKIIAFKKKNSILLSFLD